MHTYIRQSRDHRWRHWHNYIYLDNPYRKIPPGILCCNVDHAIRVHTHKPLSRDHTWRYSYTHSFVNSLVRKCCLNTFDHSGALSSQENRDSRPSCGHIQHCLYNHMSPYSTLRTYQQGMLCHRTVQRSLTYMYIVHSVGGNALRFHTNIVPNNPCHICPVDIFLNISARTIPVNTNIHQ